MSGSSARSTGSPLVVLGLPIYGSEGHVEHALESLLGLEYDNFAIVAIDDCSPDATLEIARSFAAADPRLVVESNPERLGMIGNWNRVLARTYELFPDFEYFAWASDNDMREPRWIARLVDALESEPRAAFAYSRFGTIADGERVVPNHEKWVFESTEITDPVRRLKATTNGMRAGAVMYGLHRRRTLDQVGEVPPVLLSDFVYLSYLSLFGTFVQVPEVLWFRELGRRTGGTARGQRAALFADPPARTYLPVSAQHTLWLFEKLVRLGDRPSGMGPWKGLYVTLLYQADWATRLVTRSPQLLRKRVGKLRRRLRKALVRWQRTLQKSRRGRRLLRTSLGRRMASRLARPKSSKR
jgi:glycosyltransferase involved in cell wall biosynthesis